ncbi:unnamed protein product [Allacma fusca]|uniref:Uncharacterized protein n=1 Tax=Allacma fusca TaxID=39272 RepID=A0A8J2KRM9_9HEXA|nr:unnamed protein product [Allacma fusca]
MGHVPVRYHKQLLVTPADQKVFEKRTPLATIVMISSVQPNSPEDRINFEKVGNNLPGRFTKIRPLDSGFFTGFYQARLCKV